MDLHEWKLQDLTKNNEGLWVATFDHKLPLLPYPHLKFFAEKTKKDVIKKLREWNVTVGRKFC